MISAGCRASKHGINAEWQLNLDRLVDKMGGIYPIMGFVRDEKRQAVLNQAFSGDMA